MAALHLLTATDDSDPWVRAEAHRAVQDREHSGCFALLHAHKTDRSIAVMNVVAQFLESDTACSESARDQLLSVSGHTFQANHAPYACPGRERRMTRNVTESRKNQC